MKNINHEKIDHLHDESLKTTEESQLNKDISLSLLLSYGLPTIFALIVMSTFGIVDGIFAMRRLGTEAMAAISVFTPLFALVTAIGILFAGGGIAVVMKKKGMDLYAEARQNFSLISIIAFALTLFIAVYISLFPDSAIRLLGANYEISEIALTYLRIVVWSLPLMTISQVFNQFLIADGKPLVAMGISLLGSTVSAGLNALLLFVFNRGIEALAWTTILGAAIPAITFTIIFCNNRDGTIYFAPPKLDITAIGKTLLNGTAAFVLPVSSAVTIVVMNNVLVRMDGVGAMGIAVAGMVLAMHSVFLGVFGGYLAGAAPLISYNYGKENHVRQKILFKYNVKIFAIMTVIVLSVVMVFAGLLMRIYLPSGTEIHEMATRGLRIMALSFTFAGFNFFVSAHFAALHKGAIGGILSIVRAFGFNLPLLLLLPRALGLTGVWLAGPIAETLIIIPSIILLLKLGRRYHYLG